MSGLELYLLFCAGDKLWMLKSYSEGMLPEKEILAV